MDENLSNDRQEYFEFSKTYNFKVEIPMQDEMGNYIDEVEIIEGEINFSSEIVWDSERETYEVSYGWNESTKRFDDVNGNAPDKEDEFWDDLKGYLLRQGVDSSEIDW